jgi:hypothetical protein
MAKGKEGTEDFKIFYLGIYIDSNGKIRAGVPRESKELVEEEFRPVKNIWKFDQIVTFKTDKLPKKET